MAVNHIGIHVKNYEESLQFYEKVLPTLGNRKVMSVDCVEGRGTGFGTCHPSFWINGPPASAPADKEKVSGPVHIAFSASSRKEVDAFYASALEAGGKDNGPPGLRLHYHPSYYAAFILDPDGNNIEAVNHFELPSWTVWLAVALGSATGLAAFYYWRGARR
eukprot:gene2183-2383_t